MAEGLKNAQKNVHDAHFSVHGIWGVIVDIEMDNKKGLRNIIASKPLF